MNDSSCDVFAEVAISAGTGDSDKQLQNDNIISEETVVPQSITNDGESLLLSDVVDDAMPTCLSWDDDEISDITPLNLAGPQDLSLGLDKKKYICTVCGVIFPSEKMLDIHSCNGQCDIDSRVLTSTEPLNLISRPLDLTVSGRMDDDVDDDSVYGLLMSATASLAPSQNLSCVCGKSFDLSSTDTFAQHLTTCTKSKRIPYKSCKVCGKNLYSNSGYVKHQRLHVGAYKYFCDICNRGFFDQTNLKAHADSRHSKVRRYACYLCNKSFYWKHHVKRHLRVCGRVAMTVASDIEPYVVSGAVDSSDS